MLLSFGYGSGTQDVEIPQKNLQSVLLANEMVHERRGEEAVAQAAHRLRSALPDDLPLKREYAQHDRAGNRRKYGVGQYHFALSVHSRPSLPRYSMSSALSQRTRCPGAISRSSGCSAE